MTSLLTTHSFTPTTVKTTPAHTIIPMEPKLCQPSLLTLWLAHPLALCPPYGPLQPLYNPSPQEALRTWWPCTNMIASPSIMWPKGLLQPSKGVERGTPPINSLLPIRYKMSLPVQEEH
jgi:hypothetical protein